MITMFTGKAVLTTGSETETYRVGEILGRLIDSPLIITLNGELGAGKTVLVRGAAAGLGVAEPVRSPTFTLMMIYSGRNMPVYHFDFYRLTGEDELEALDLDEYLGGQGVAFIEWAGKFPDSLPRERLDINLAYDFNGESGSEKTADFTISSKRIITFYPQGVFYGKLTDQLFEIVKHNVKGELSQ